MKQHVDPDFLLELGGYRLTTAEIIYYMPDHPKLLQTFIWQHLDRSPDFPRLHAFLVFWQHHIDAKLYSVRVAQAQGMSPSDTRFADIEFFMS